jgi:hypothetical protein
MLHGETRLLPNSGASPLELSVALDFEFADMAVRNSNSKMLYQSEVGLAPQQWAIAPQGIEGVARRLRGGAQLLFGKSAKRESPVTHKERAIGLRDRSAGSVATDMNAAGRAAPELLLSQVFAMRMQLRAGDHSGRRLAVGTRDQAHRYTVATIPSPPA